MKGISSWEFTNNKTTQVQMYGKCYQNKHPVKLGKL